jgi:hypothetical protein
MKTVLKATLPFVVIVGTTGIMCQLLHSSQLFAFCDGIVAGCAGAMLGIAWSEQ